MTYGTSKRNGGYVLLGRRVAIEVAIFVAEHGADGTNDVVDIAVGEETGAASEDGPNGFPKGLLVDRGAGVLVGMDCLLVFDGLLAAESETHGVETRSGLWRRKGGGATSSESPDYREVEVSSRRVVGTR